MPYYISESQSDCDGWAAVKQESDGSYTTIGCHASKQDAIDQMVAVSIAEDIQPGGEVSSRSEELKKIERRTFQVQDVEARESDDGVLRLSGYAAVFNDASVPLPFKERISPGAFRKTLTEQPDVRLLINHEGLPLARTKNGTLTLREDDRGLYFDAELAQTQEARDIHTLIARGDVDQMSFAFRVIRQKWNENRTERILTEVSLADGDVSVVTYPAYPTTTVEAREHIKQAIQAIKEGRQIDDATMLVLQTVFDDMSEGHEYIMKALAIFEALMGERKYDEDETDEDEDNSVATVSEDQSRKISLCLAKALINNTK